MSTISAIALFRCFNPLILSFAGIVFRHLFNLSSDIRINQIHRIGRFQLVDQETETWC